MKVGMTMPCQHPFQSSEMMLAVAEQVEADSIWAPDHLLGAFHPALWSDMAYASLSPDPDALYDPFVCLALLGQRSTLPMGVCVTDTTRRRAADVARTALTLHHVCQGGFNLGVGSGEAESLTPFGYDFSAPVSRTEQFLVELRSLLDEGAMPGMTGRTGLPLVRDELGGPKVWVGGHGPRMMRLTGQYGDGWLPAWPMSAETYASRRRTVAEHADRAGRPAPESGLLVILLLGRSREYVAELMDREPLAKLFALFCPADRWEAHGYEHPFGPACRGFIDLVVHDLDPEELRDLAPNIPFELVEELLFVGNADEVGERVAPYAKSGLEHAILGNVTGVVGGMDEITGNLDQLVALRHGLAQL